MKSLFGLIGGRRSVAATFPIGSSTGELAVPVDSASNGWNLFGKVLRYNVKFPEAFPRQQGHFEGTMYVCPAAAGHVTVRDVRVKGAHGSCHLGAVCVVTRHFGGMLQVVLGQVQVPEML